MRITQSDLFKGWLRRQLLPGAAMLFIFPLIWSAGCDSKGSGLPPGLCQRDPDSCNEPPPPPPSTSPLTAEILNPHLSLIQNNTGVAVRFSRSVNPDTLATNISISPLSGGVPGPALTVELDTDIFTESSGTIALYRGTGGVWGFDGEQLVRFSVTQGVRAAGDGRSLEAAVSADLSITTTNDTSVSVPTGIQIDGKAIATNNPLYTNNLTPSYSLLLGEPVLFRVIGSGDDPICMNQSATIALTGISVTGTFPGLLFDPATEIECDLTLRFWDLAGNTADIGLTYVFDDVAPLAPTVDPTDVYPGNFTADASVILEVSFTADSTLDFVRVTGGSALTTQTIDSNPELVTVPLNVGGNSLSVRLVDKAGNQGATTALTVTRDNTPPVVTNFALTSQGTVKRTLSNLAQTSINGTSLGAGTVPVRLTMALDEPATVTVYDTDDPDNPLAEDSFATGNIIPLDFTLPANDTMTIRVRSTNIVGLSTLSAEYAVRTDTVISPNLSVTGADTPGHAIYQVPDTPAFRSAGTDFELEGVVERGSTVVFRTSGIPHSVLADPDDDLFPPAAGPKAVVQIAPDSQATILGGLTDPAGNSLTLDPDPVALLINDQTPPDPPDFAGASADAGCTVSSFDLGDGLHLVKLIGDIADCASIELNGTVEYDLPFPTTGGATYIRGTLGGDTFELPDPVWSPDILDEGPWEFDLPVDGLQANSIRELHLTAYDRVGNESDPVRVILMTLDDPDAGLEPVILSVMNDSTGGRPDMVLGLEYAEGPVYTATPTNAGAVIVTGLTTPGALLDIFEGTPPPAGTSLFDDAALPLPEADPVTGLFSFTILPAGAFAAQTTFPAEEFAFTIRSTSPDATDTDIELHIVRDEQTPAADPVNCLADVTAASPEGGVLVSTVLVLGACRAQYHRTELVVENLGPGNPACPAASGGSPVSAPLAETGSSLVKVEAVTGDTLMIYFRDEAGNETLTGNRACAIVPPNRVVAVRLETGGSETDPAFYMIDLDAADPELVPLEMSPIDALPAAEGPIGFFGAGFLIDMGRADEENLFLQSFSIGYLPVPGATLADSAVFPFQFIAGDVRRDADGAALLAPFLNTDGSGPAQILLAEIDPGNGQFLSGEIIEFPGTLTASLRFPLDIRLLPTAEGKPRRAVVLRYRLGLEDLPGDLLLFNLDAKTSVFPAEPFVSTENGSKVGYQTCRSPSQVTAAPDGLRGYVVCNTSTPENDETIRTLTVIDMEPVTPVQGHATSHELEYDFGDGPEVITNLRGIAPVPDSTSAVLLDAAGILYLVENLHPGPLAVVDAVFVDGHSYSTVHVTSDGTRVIASDGNMIDVFTLVGSEFLRDGDDLPVASSYPSPEPGAPLGSIAPVP
ncbi:MAG: hypothetical protein KIT79_13215 [Deltaproteobacteria bacterium]|nr:hypothetical protein [Deltaproteobacteria bacterium]